MNRIKSGLSNLKNESKKMAEDEIKMEKPYEIVNTVEGILQFNEKKKKKKNNKKDMA